MKGYRSVEVEVQGFVVSCQQKDLLSNEEEAEWDFFDFEAENSLAAATGSLLWDGSFAVIQLLKPGPASILDLLLGKRVLELGAGVGLAGLACAAAGAHVMLTDIPSVSQGILGRNVASNLASFARQCKQQQGVTAPSRQDLAEEGSGLGINRPWRQSTPLGAGSCAVGTLDFTRPVAEQDLSGGNSPYDAEVVLAIDIVWLKELVAPLASTIYSILSSSSAREEGKKRALLAFGERSHAHSKHFVSLDEVCLSLQEAGCAPSVHTRQEIERMGEKLSIVVLSVEHAS